jgi:cytochrome c
MKITVAQLAFLGLLPLATASHGSERLAEQMQCVQCHRATQAFAGPSFQQIAQKYKDQPGAVDRISAIIRQGSRATGGPHWGKATMPDTAERPEVNAADARILAGWILQQ